MPGISYLGDSGVCEQFINALVVLLLVHLQAGGEPLYLLHSNPYASYEYPSCHRQVVTLIARLGLRPVLLLI